MPATPLPTSARHTPTTKTVYYFLPTVAAFASTGIPTRAEINAGTSLTGEIVDVAGWSTTTTYIVTPSLTSRFQPKLVDVSEAEDSSLTFAADLAGVDVRTVLDPGDAGYIVIADGGDVTAYKADVFKVEVSSITVMRVLSGSEVRVRIDFSQVAVPKLGIALPATS